MQEVDPTTFADESKIIHWKMAISGSEQQQNLKGTTRKREKKKKKSIFPIRPRFQIFR